MASMPEDRDSQRDAPDSGGGDAAAEAAEWVARREGAERWTEADERALQAWLAADPQRRREFEILREIYARSGGAAAGAAPARGGLVRGGSGRLASWAGAAAVVVLGAFLAWRLLAPGGFRAEYATAIGQIREVVLPEGSRLALDADTTLDVRFEADRRLVLLRRGRAMFSVTAESGRPFVARTPAGDVSVIGTDFEVGLVDRRVRVAVLEGEVLLRPAEGLGQGRALRGGEGALFEAAGMAGPVEPVEANAFAAWRQGRLEFRNRPLGEVVLEVGRYLEQDVRVVTEALRQTPVSGSFNARDLGEFFNAVQQMLPVRARHASPTEIVIEPE